MTIRTGIIGPGMIGRSFMEQAKKSNNFKIVALCSKTKETLKEAAKIIPGVKCYLNKEDFFAQDFDAVIVCTPHADHAMDGIEALKSGKHVLIEKPIATNPSDLNHLLQKSLEYPHQVVTALPHCAYEFLRFTKDLIRRGTIGKVTALHSYLDVPGPPRSNWYYSKEAVGGAILDTLPYALSRLLSLVKMNIKKAYGLKNQLITHRICGDGRKIDSVVDDNASLLLILSEGQQAIVRSNWNHGFAQDFLIVHGRQGEIHIDAWRNQICLKTHKRIDIPGMVEKERGVFNYAIPSQHPEKLKLDFFFQQINHKKSNLKEVGYFMNFILALALQDGEIVPPKPYYSKRPQGHFRITKQYI